MELKKEEYVSDQDDIVAISTKVVFDNAQTVILETAKLWKAMELVKTLGWEYIAVSVQTDNPLLIAHEKGKQKGILISPKVEWMQRRLGIIMDEECKIKPDRKTNWVWDSWPDENIEDAVYNAIDNKRDILVLQPRS